MMTEEAPALSRYAPPQYRWDDEGGDDEADHGPLLRGLN
jgi:hypothetical protein